MRITRAALVLAATAFTTITVTAGASGASAQPVGQEHRFAAQAVAAVTSDGVATAPSDFAVFSGYYPVVIDGYLANPNGDCSSPIPLPDEFDSACKAHDLGYDLLRYAHSHGAELGPWARQALDSQLDRRMHEACDGRVSPASRSYCFSMADIAATAVNGNSWRQNYLTPVKESGFEYGTAGVLGASVLAFSFVRSRRVDPSDNFFLPTKAVAA
ncbi:hypothetical protein [Rhodococcus sp. IEGM 1379]|uniref:hypothetical protein n=1 Tax=Rhodococcus sp. IEGM 1379 TaxID=3047086 RepID=UPI0024B69566|nr:hypothetical protein [Rhodococcus sp. IEGM 1379]MDI9917770.1 hypothetical protein [Rhodococcus sp. IEGM 1379]